MWLGEVKEVEKEPVSGCMNLLKAHKMQSIFSGITHKAEEKHKLLQRHFISPSPSPSLSLPLLHTLCSVAGTSAANWRTRHSTNSVASLLYLKDDAIVSSLARRRKVAGNGSLRVQPAAPVALLWFASVSSSVFVCVSVSKCTLWCRS